MQTLRTVAVAGMTLILAAHASIAEEPIFDEFRFGASASVQDKESREDDVFPEVTVFLDPFDLDNAVDWKQEIMRPRVNLGASITTSDEANQVFGGLSWQISVSDRIFAEAGFGGVWHVPGICWRRLPYRSTLECHCASRARIACESLRWSQ